MIVIKGARLWLRIAVLFFIPALALFSGCGSSSSDGRGGTGTVSLSLSDATIDGAQAVYVTVEEVSVHKEGGGGWRVIAEPNQTYNLLELVNGVRETLGIAELEAGHYTQLRMKVGEQPDDGINILSVSHSYYEWGNYVIDDSDEPHELKIPSGYQSGVKVVCGFDINADQTTELLLDFDAARSIVEAGSSDNLLLKPTIKVLRTEECAIIDGTVTDKVSGVGLEGVLVSVQSYDSAPSSDDPKDEVVVRASTITDENGSYVIFIAPGAYSLVAYKDGYSQDCAAIVAETNGSHTQDFEIVELGPSSIGTISGDISIASPSPEQHVTISFRQLTQCRGREEYIDIELKSVNVAVNVAVNEEGIGTYGETLPAGAYTVVASTYNETTQSVEVDITDFDQTQNFEFPPLP